MPYTTLAEEDILVSSLGVPVDDLGTSVLGCPLRCLRFGTGPVLLLCVGTQHGWEMPGREGILQFAQELAANPPAVLGSYSVLLVPTANPDGVDLVTRENANGVDTNRDHLDLTQPETRALATVLTERPLVVLDLHTGGVEHDVQMLPANSPGLHTVTAARADAVLAAVTSIITGEGYTVGEWHGGEPTMLRNRQGLDNGVGIIAEIDVTPTEEQRTALALELCRAALTVAYDQAVTLQTDRATADATAVDPLQIGASTVDPTPAGYRLRHIPAEHVDAFGLSAITALSRPLLGYLLDPAANHLRAERLSTLEPAPMRYSHTVTFTTDGMFTKAAHAGIVAVEVECKAGSGGGAGAEATGAGENSGGGGGGGGEYRVGWVTVTELAADETVTVGAGGLGGQAAGGNGGPSALGGHVTAVGGLGGFHRGASTAAVEVVPGGAGGDNGSGGHQSIPGGPGGMYVGSSGRACGGIGGTSHWGGGGRASTSTNYGPGEAYGGGGAGAANAQNRPAQSGAAGAPGMVRVHVYVAGGV